MKLELVKIAMENHDLQRRNNEASTYSKQTRKNNAKKDAVGAVLFATVLATACVAYGNQQQSYTYAAPLESESLHYQYLTEAKCPITSVDMDTNEICVLYRGNEYAYYAEGKIDITEKVIVVFNENMEIVDVK